MISSSPAASPSARGGSSCSCTQITHEPSGARDGIDGHRLTEDDRRLGREQAAVCLVDRARDSVEAGCEVDDRRAGEPLVAVPARQLVHGDVDLHLAAAVAEAERLVANPRRRVGLAEQPAVELRRRDAGKDGAARGDRFAVGQAHACRLALRHDDPLDLGLGAQLAARVAHDRRERVDEARAAALRHRHPAELERAGDHLRHEAGHGLVGAEAGVQHPRREQAVRTLVREGLVEPVARRRAASVRRTRPARAARTACTPCGRARGPASTRARCRERRTRCRPPP